MDSALAWASLPTFGALDSGESPARPHKEKGET
jgi:hypothetical protein